ncbi:MAG: hypothetical protein WBE32_11045 [Pseudolabrys sp.]
MDLTARGVLIGLASIIAVCGPALLWVDRKSVTSMHFIKRHLGFWPDDGDGSLEAMLITVIVVLITAVAFRWAFK